jgi:hypothetical protein
MRSCRIQCFIFEVVTDKVNVSILIPALALKLMLLLPPSGLEPLPASLDPVLLESAERIDIVSVSGKFSYAEYHRRGMAEPERGAFPVHSVVPSAVPFGECRLQKGVMHRKGGARCGYVLPLNRGAGSVNLLGYRDLVIKGHFTGSWRLAFADDALAALQDNVPVGSMKNSDTQSFNLAKVLGSADLSRARHLVLLLDSPTGSARVDQVSFSHPEQSAQKNGRGIWIWRRDNVLGREESVLKRLSAQGIKRIYLQVGDDPEVFAPFLGKAAKDGVEVFALDGSPTYIAAPQELLQRIKRVDEYNGSHPGARYAGFQTDIEPYLNKDFHSRKAYYASAYLELLDRIKKSSALRLSVVVPFWFDTLYAGGKSLVQGVVERADEVVVMSYRTDASTVQAISRSTLSLGEQYGKPVWLGVELGAIPDEQHRELEKCSPDSAGALKLGAGWWCDASRYLVPGSRISFRSKMEELPSFMQTRIPFDSFNGWVLHSYEELR